MVQFIASFNTFSLICFLMMFFVEIQNRVNFLVNEYKVESCYAHLGYEIDYDTRK